MDIKDVAGFSEPAKALIERCGDALGAIFHPVQTRRNAKADAEAALIQARSQVAIDKIKALGNIEVTEIEERGLAYLVCDAGKKQQNLENIIIKALPDLNDDAKPGDIEEDWLSNFFDKGRLISADDIQLLFGKVLAGEANEPGKYSKRIVNCLQELSQHEAELFLSLCRFTLRDNNLALIYNVADEIYRSAGFDAYGIIELQSLGLIFYSPIGNYFEAIDGKIDLTYFGNQFSIHVSSLIYDPHSAAPQFNAGRVTFTKLGEDLMKLCPASPIEGFEDYLLMTWMKLGYKVTVR